VPKSPEADNSGLLLWAPKKFILRRKNPLESANGLANFSSRQRKEDLAEEPMMETSIVLTVAAIISVLCVLASRWMDNEGGLT
jgi:hypothetical protein